MYCYKCSRKCLKSKPLSTSFRNVKYKFSFSINYNQSRKSNYQTIEIFQFIIFSFLLVDVDPSSIGSEGASQPESQNEKYTENQQQKPLNLDSACLASDGESKGKNDKPMHKEEITGTTNNNFM